VKIPVPMMLAITMEQAVKKPMVRRGRGDFTEGRSAIAVMVEPTIAPLEAVWLIIDRRFRFDDLTIHRFSDFVSCQKPFPASL
jgi:hypothetical protein